MRERRTRHQIEYDTALDYVFEKTVASSYGLGENKELVAVVSALSGVRWVVRDRAEIVLDTDSLLDAVTAYNSI